MVRVMSEVHRYQVVQMLTEDGNKLTYSPAGPWVVLAPQFDSMKICFDAQRLRADTAEDDSARKDRVIEDMIQSNSDMTTCLAAAEQRIAELVAAFTPLIKNWDDLAAGESLNVDRARAALNQKSEGESQAHICSGCGAKGWTANCAQCVPY